MELKKLYENLEKLRLENGLFIASQNGNLYRKVWIRDSFYESLAYLKTNPEYFKQTYQTLLDYYRKIENQHTKLTSLINSPTKYGYEYPHPRFYPNLEEINEEWGFKQLDNFGEVLYGLWLGESNGIHIIRDEEDRRIIDLLIKCLESIEYWKQPNNSLWEEVAEVFSASIGACLAGLTAIKLLGFKVDQRLLDEAHKALNELLPGESKNREFDLATLTLIYPFNIVDPFMAKKIIHNIETHLLRERGVIRYIGDRYYNCSDKWFCDLNGWWFDNSKPQIFVGSEMEWCMGISFLALAHYQLGDIEKAKYYNQILADKCCIDEGIIPEGYYSRQNFPNANKDLGWSISLAILTMEALGQDKI